MPEGISGSHTKHEEGKRLPGYLTRPYRSTYRHKYSRQTYIQVDEPNGSNWMLEADYYQSQVGIEDVIAGTDISIDKTDPKNPIINWVGTHPSAMQSVVAGDNILVDNTDPINPIVSSFANVGKTLYVDSVFGNDTTALRESFTSPFLTIEAAEDASAPGDTIIIRPGSYNLTRSLGKDKIAYISNHGVGISTSFPLFNDFSVALNISAYNFNVALQVQSAILTGINSSISFYNSELESATNVIELGPLSALSLKASKIKSGASCIVLDSITEVLMKETTLEAVAFSIESLNPNTVISINSSSNISVNSNTTIVGTGLVVDPNIK